MEWPNLIARLLEGVKQLLKDIHCRKCIAKENCTSSKCTVKLSDILFDLDVRIIKQRNFAETEKGGLDGVE